MVEIWKDIKGYENLYQVSNLGNIKRLKRCDRKSNNYFSFEDYKDEKKLKPIPHKNKYLFVCLSKDGKKKVYSIHRLVAETFIPNDNNYKCINHKDENRQNNNINNLEWCDYKYNSNYGARNIKISNKLKVPIIQYDVYENLIKVWKSAVDAGRELGIASSHISSCCCGNRLTAGGFIWKHYEKGREETIIEIEEIDG